MPTTGKPSACSAAAPRMVPSPPIATSASTPCALQLAQRLLLHLGLGEIREARGLQHRAAALQDAADVARAQLADMSPRARPSIGAPDADCAACPSASAVRTTARTAAFIPGASPPAVRTAMLFGLAMVAVAWCRATLTCVKRRRGAAFMMA